MRWASLCGALRNTDKGTGRLPGPTGSWHAMTCRSFSWKRLRWWSSTPAVWDPAPAILGGSIGKEKIGTGKRSRLRLLRPSANLQVAKIDGCKAEAFNEACHRGLCGFVIPGNKQYTPRACQRPGSFRKLAREHGVESLHQARSWGQVRDNFAGNAPPEIIQDIQMLRIEKRIGCVNQNATVPRG